MYFQIAEADSESFMEILIKAIATAAPNNSKTIETVVDVGIANVLKTSKSSISVIITAIKM